MSDLQFTIGFKTDQTGLRQLESDIEKITKKAKAIEAQIGAGMSKGENVAALKARYEKLIASLTLASRAHQELSAAMANARTKGESLDSTYVKLTQQNLKNVSVLGNLTTSLNQNSQAMNKNATSSKEVSNADLARYLTSLESSLKDVTSAINNQTSALNTQNESQKKSIELAEQRAAALKKANEARAALTITDETDKIVTQSTLLSKSISVAKQALLTAPIYGLAYTATSQLAQALTNYIQLDTVLNRIAIVTGKTTEEVRGLSHEFSNLAKDLSVTTETYAKGALIFYQQGGDAVRYVKDLTEATLQLSNITGQSSEDTADYITAIGNSFKMIERGPRDIQKISDTLAYLDRASAASAYEIGEAMKRSASVFESAGIDFQTASAMIATSLQVTRAEPERVGTAFKTLIETMQEVKAGGPKAIRDFSNQVQDVIDKFPNMKDKLKLFEDNGEMVGAKDFLQQLQKTYAELKETDPRGIIAVVQAIGGKENANILLSLLENQKLFQELVGGARGSVGEAAKSQEEFSKSIQANIEGLKNAWEGLVDKLLKSDAIISLVNALIKVFETLGKVISGTSGPLNILVTAFGAMTGLVIATRLLGVFRAATTSSKVGLIDLTFALIGFKDVAEKGIDIDLENYNREVEIARLKTEQLKEEMKRVDLQGKISKAHTKATVYKKFVEAGESVTEPGNGPGEIAYSEFANWKLNEVPKLKKQHAEAQQELLDAKTNLDLFEKENEMRAKKLKLLEREREFAELGPHFSFQKFKTYTKTFATDLIGDLAKDIGPKLLRSLGMGLVTGIITLVSSLFQANDLAKQTGKGFIDSFFTIIKDEIGSLMGGGIGGLIGGIFGPVGAVIGSMIGSAIGDSIQTSIGGTKTREQIEKQTKELNDNLQQYVDLSIKKKTEAGLTLEETKAYYGLLSVMSNYSIIAENTIKVKEDLIQKTKAQEAAEKAYLSAVESSNSAEGRAQALNALTKANEDYNLAKQKQILIEELNKQAIEIGTEKYNELYNSIVSNSTNTFQSIKRIVDSNPDIFKAIKDDLKDFSVSTSTDLSNMRTAAETYLKNMETMSRSQQMTAVKDMIRSFGITDDIVDMTTTNAAALMQIMATTAIATQQFVALQETIGKIQQATASGEDEIDDDLRDQFFNQRRALAQTLGVKEESVASYRKEGYSWNIATPEERASFNASRMYLANKVNELKKKQGGKMSAQEEAHLNDEIAYYEHQRSELEGMIYNQEDLPEQVGNIDRNIIKESLKAQIIDLDKSAPREKPKDDTLVPKEIETPTETTGGAVSVSTPEPKKLGLDLIRQIKSAEADIQNIKESNIDLKEKIEKLKVAFKNRDTLLAKLQKEYEDGLVNATKKGSFLYQFIRQKGDKSKKNKLSIVDGIITDASIQNVLFDLEKDKQDKELELKKRGYEGKKLTESQIADETALKKQIKAKEDFIAVFKREVASYTTIANSLNETKIDIKNAVTDEIRDILAIYDEMHKPGPELYKKETKNLAVKEEQLLGLLDNKIKIVEEATQTSKEKLGTLTDLYQQQMNLFKSAKNSYDAALKTSMDAIVSKYGVSVEGGVLSEDSISQTLGKLEDAYIAAQQAVNEAMKSPRTLDNVQAFYALVDAQYAAETSLNNFKDEIKSYEEIASNANKITEQAAEAFKKAKQAIIELGEAAAEENFTEILFGQSSLDKVDTYFSAVLDYQDEYLNKLEKSISLSQIQNKLDQDKLKYGNIPQLVAFQEKITKMKKDGKEYSQEELDLLSAEYDVSLKQIMLERMKKTGAETRLMRDAAGNWVYGAKESKTAEEVTSAKGAVSESASNYYEKSQAAVKSTLNKMREVSKSLIDVSSQTLKENLIIQDATSSPEAKKKATDQVAILDKIKVSLEKQLTAEKATLGREVEYLKKSAVIAGAAAADDPVMTKFLDKILNSSSDKLSEVFGEQLPDELKDILEVPVSEISQLTSMMGTTLTGLTDGLVTVVDTLKTALSDLRVSVNNATTRIGGSVTAVNPSPVVPVVPVAPTTTESPKTLAEQGKMVTTVAGRGIVVVDAKTGEIDSETYGKGSTANAAEYKALQVQLKENKKDPTTGKTFVESEIERANKVIAARKAAGIDTTLQEKYLKSITKLDTGGYTGEFDGGKVALLHSKELVLNKQDTRNILDAVRINRDISSMMQDNSRSIVGAIPKAGDVSNSTIINASFPNVSSSEEIRKAFANMSNSASQFANRMRPQYS